MKIGVFADLHYSSNLSSLSKINQISREQEKMDCILLCGDNAEPSKNFENHRNLFRFLRTKFSCPIGFVVGNHDLWMKQHEISCEKALFEIYPVLAKEYEINCLEQDNLKIEDFTIAGTYGHYDYSLTHFSRGLKIKDITEFHLRIPGRSIVWNDGALIERDKKNDKDICNILLDGLEQRIKDTKKNLILISHTVGSNSSVGHLEKSIVQDFFLAYSGSKRLGRIIEKYQPNHHFCGHTHRFVQTTIGKTQVTNIGSDYELLRYCILDTNSGKMEVKE